MGEGDDDDDEGGGRKNEEDEEARGGRGRAIARRSKRVLPTKRRVLDFRSFPRVRSFIMGAF